MKNFDPTRPLAIGFVFDDSLDKPDGVQQYILAIGEWLRAAGHDVHYLVGETKRTDIPNVHSLSRNIAVRFNGNRLTMPLPASKKAIKQLLKDVSFDVLHVQVPYSPMLASRIIKAANKKTAVIGTFHIAPLDRLVGIGNRLLGAWLRRSLKRFDKVVSVSSAAADFARRCYGLNTEVIPNVVNIERFTKAKGKNLPGDGVKILFLGRLVPRKGCSVLLRSVAKLSGNADLPPFSVTICGTGPLEAKLKEYVKVNRLESRVTFTGFVAEADKPGMYKGADITVFPSSGGESFGIVLIEAMAAVHPVVLAGDNPGYRSVMGGKPELLFDPLDSVVLAHKLAAHLADQNLRTEAVNWQNQTVKQYDVAAVGARLADLYKRSANGRQQF